MFDIIQGEKGPQADKVSSLTEIAVREEECKTQTLIHSTL